jgi:hypothetical protein
MKSVIREGTAFHRSPDGNTPHACINARAACHSGSKDMNIDFFHTETAENVIAIPAIGLTLQVRIAPAATEERAAPDRNNGCPRLWTAHAQV